MKTKEELERISEFFAEDLEKTSGATDEFVVSDALQKFLLRAAHREDHALRQVRDILRNYDVDEFDAKEIVEYLKVDLLRRDAFADSVLDMLGENAVLDSNGDSHLLHLLYGRSCDLEYVFKKIIENRIPADVLTDVNNAGNPLVHRLVENGLMDERNVERFAEVCHFYPEILRIKNSDGRELQDAIRISSSSLRYAFEEAAEKYGLKLSRPRASKPAEFTEAFEAFLERQSGFVAKLPDVNVSVRPLENRVVEAYAAAGASSALFSLVTGAFILVRDAALEMKNRAEDAIFEKMKEKYESRRSASGETPEKRGRDRELYFDEPF